MRALITGGAGFIGSHLAEGLLSSGWSVVILDDLSTGLEENVPHSVELVVGNAMDSAILDKLVPGCDAIFTSRRFPRFRNL
jgi:UDP-glucose 4-epimerase